MAELPLKDAIRIASELVTIGHPFSQSAINATAMDLLDWCKGAVIDGQVFSPEDQAQRVVTTARTTWDGWPETGGTKQLLALFRSIFDRKPEPSLVVEHERLRQQYGPPDKQWSTKMLRTAATGDKHADFKAQTRAMLLKSIEDAIYFTEGRGSFDIGGNSKSNRQDQAFWQAAMDHHNRNHAEDVALVRRSLSEREAS